MGVKENCKLIKKEELVSGIYKYSVEAPEIAKSAKPGQFLEIKVTKEENDKANKLIGDI